MQSAWDEVAYRIHSMPCSMLRVLGAIVGYLLHCCLVAFPISNVGNQLSLDELRNCNCFPNWCQNFWKHEMLLWQNCLNYGCMGFPALKTQAAFHRHSTINFILGRSLNCIYLPSTLEPVGLTRDRRPDELTWALVQRSKPSMGCNSCGHFCLVPQQRQHQTSKHCSNRGWGCKTPKIQRLSHPSFEVPQR